MVTYGGTVRNGCLARFITTTAGWVPVMQVPVDTVVLLKRVDVFNNSDSSTRVIMSVIAANGGAQIVLIDQVVDASGLAEKELWLGMNPGDAVQFFANTPSCSIWLSGAWLPGGFATLPAAFTPRPLPGIGP